MLLVDEIEDLVNGLILIGNVQTVVYSAPNSTLTLDNSYHARVSMTVNIDGTDYSIISANQALNQIVIAGDLTGALKVTFPIPNFFHGTVYATNSHIINIKNHANRVPMIYLHEIFEETDQGAQGSSISAPIRLYFLDECDLDNWTTDDHYSKVITGLKRVVKAFKDYLDANLRVVTNDVEYRETNYVPFGKFTDMKGMESSIFDFDLSGVGLAFTLVLRKCCTT